MLLKHIPINNAAVKKHDGPPDDTMLVSVD